MFYFLKIKLDVCCIVGIVYVLINLMTCRVILCIVFIFTEINVKENQSGNKERTIQRHGQHWVHETQDKQTNKTKDTT
jgi:hypothetical protein